MCRQAGDGAQTGTLPVIRESLLNRYLGVGREDLVLGTQICPYPSGVPCHVLDVGTGVVVLVEV